LEEYFAKENGSKPAPIPPGSEPYVQECEKEQPNPGQTAVQTEQLPQEDNKDSASPQLQVSHLTSVTCCIVIRCQLDLQDVEMSQTTQKEVSTSPPTSTQQTAEPSAEPDATEVPAARDEDAKEDQADEEEHMEVDHDVQPAERTEEPTAVHIEEEDVGVHDEGDEAKEAVEEPDKKLEEAKEDKEDDDGKKQTMSRAEAVTQQRRLSNSRSVK
jgi:hypothetical protein